MSKGEGKLIAVKFTDKLLGDVSAALKYDIGDINYALEKNATASYKSSYAYKAVDANIYTSWSSNTNICWITIDLGQLREIIGLYIFGYDSNYRGKDCSVLGSIDNVSWTTIYTGTLANVAEQTILLTKCSCRYVKLAFTSGYNTAIAIYNLKIFNAVPTGNEKAFKVSGQQYDHVNGILVNTDYPVESVVSHSSGAETLLLTINSLKRFNNVVGNLNVAYDASLGNLLSPGGIVKSFNATFAPTELVKKVNPWDNENLTVSLLPVFVSTKVLYKYGYATEQLSVQLLSSVVVTKVGSSPL